MNESNRILTAEQEVEAILLLQKAEIRDNTYQVRLNKLLAEIGATHEPRLGCHEKGKVKK
jgi:hypothetical protein